MVVLGWVLGMSLRGVMTFLYAFGLTISHMTVCRESQEQSKLMEKGRRRQPVRVLGVDGVYPLGKHPVLIVFE